MKDQNNHFLTKWGLKMGSLLLVLMFCSTAMFAQQNKVSLSLKNEPIKSAISAIETQTGYEFVYSPSFVDLSKKVTVEVKDKSLTEVLKVLFSNTDVTYELKGKQIVLSAKQQAASAPTDTKRGGKTKITGKVVDERGEPFPFVDVIMKGLAQGTVTDVNGNYSLDVPAGTTHLTFAFMGYKSEDVEIGKRAVIDHTMRPESLMMDEIVVIGFGEQKKIEMSSAVSTVKSEEIMKSPVSNISNTIAGRIPGLITMQGSGQPGVDESTIYVRGAGTWNNSEPLYVIDGVERNQAQFLRIDPSEVESFSILKDAAATAVYGSKAANGVVLLTTKRGQEGKMSIQFNSSVTLNQPTRYPKYLNSYESLKLYNEALQNDGGDPLYSEEELLHYALQDDPYRYPDTDWYSLMLKDFSTQSNNSLSIRGGSKSVRYFLSGTYMYQGGQLKTAQGRIYNPKFGYERYTFRSNVDILLTDVFTISIDLGGGITDKSQPTENTDIFMSMNRIPSWVMPATNPDGSYAGTTDFPSNNPMYLLNTRGNTRTKNNTVTTSVKLSYDLKRLVKGLKISARAAYDSNFGNNKKWTETQSTFQLISAPGKADRYQSFLEPAFFGSSASSVSSTRKVYGEVDLRWRRTFKDHEVSLAGIANLSDYRSGTGIPYKSVSFIARANYSYKKLYYLEANAAYRGSENFAPGRRFGLFPSVSVGWNIHNEPFMASVGWVNNLKFRASYGITGNDYANVRFIYKDGKWTTGTTSYARFGVEYGATNGYTLEPVIANPYATWETAYQTNIGLDFALFKNKITVSVDKFFENREGILMTPNSIPGILGIGVSDMNIGKTTKGGWEFEAGYNQRFGKDFDLSVRGNFTYVKNKVVYKDEPEDQIWYQKEEGYPIGQQFGYVVLGFFKDQQEIDNSPVQRVGDLPIPGDLKYLDYNNDGEINTYDRVAIGYPRIPMMTFGLSMDLSYKNFSLGVLFQGSAKSSVFISNYLMYEFYNRGKVQQHHLGRWTPETAETATYPALHIGATSQNHVRNTFFQKDNPFLRLKNIELAYTIGSKKLKKVGLNGLRIYMSGINLFTWDKLKTVDPETPTGSTGAIYPQTRGGSLGVNLTF